MSPLEGRKAPAFKTSFCFALGSRWVRDARLRRLGKKADVREDGRRDDSFHGRDRTGWKSAEALAAGQKGRSASG